MTSAQECTASASFTVAIDGPAAAGKGTIGRALAARFGFVHLDTGLLYRAVARRVLANGRRGDRDHAIQIALGLTQDDIECPGLRTRDVTLESSRVAAIPGVRSALLAFQRRFARRPGGAVLDGRDIATVIVPDADVKFFVTADIRVRARRRRREMSDAGAAVSLSEVLADLQERDKRDSDRGLAALKKADDAILLDTTGLSIAEAIETAVAAVNEKFAAVR